MSYFTKPHIPSKLRLLGCWLGLLLAGLLPCQAWQSSLYPVDWMPPKSASFTSDSTAAIRAAIDAAAAADATGVVYLPAGTYEIEPQGSNSYALWIASPDIVLRGAGVGQTFLLNTSYTMRSKQVIKVAPASTSTEPAVALTADLDNPTRRIPVADAAAFAVGDKVRLEWTFTQGWIDEHGQGSYRTAPGTVPSPAQYLREVTAVHTGAGWIEVDVPTRYTMKMRDDARVVKISGQLSGIGLEDFSIGNVQHHGSEWGSTDYTNPGTSAYEVHNSFLISMQDSFDSWVDGPMGGATVLFEAATAVHSRHALPGEVVAALR